VEVFTSGFLSFPYEPRTSAAEWCGDVDWRRCELTAEWRAGADLVRVVVSSHVLTEAWT